MSIESKDTTAWRVIEQVLKHVWGPGEELDDDEVLLVCKLFQKAKGSWKKIVEGDYEHIEILEECINNVLLSRKMEKIAARVSGNV